MIKSTILSCVLFATTCAVWFNPQHDREMTTGIALALFLGICGAIAAMRKASFVKTPGRVAFWAVVAYGVLITASFVSLTTHTSMSYRPLLVQYLGIGAFLSVYLFYDRIETFLKISTALFSAAIVCAVAHVAFHHIGGYQYYTRIFMHRNVAGCFFAMMLPLAYGMVWGKDRMRLWAIPAVGLLWYAMFITGSRSGIFAATCVTIIYALHGRKWILLLGLVIVFGAILGPRGMDKNPIGTRMFSLSASEATGALTKGREPIYPKMWAMVKAHPILGVGIGNMHINAPTSNTGPHSLYLALHSYGGILAIVLWMIPALAVLFLPKHSIPERMACFAYMICAVWSECGANVPPNPVIFWALMGVVLVKGETWPDNHNALRRSAAALLLCCGAWGSCWSINHWRANRAILIGSAMGQQKFYQKAIEQYDLALELEPLHYKALYARGMTRMALRQHRAGYDLAALDYLVPDFGLTRRILR